jgi:hypothetical protein
LLPGQQRGDRFGVQTGLGHQSGESASELGDRFTPRDHRRGLAALVTLSVFDDPVDGVALGGGVRTQVVVALDRSGVIGVDRGAPGPAGPVAPL